MSALPKAVAFFVIWLVLSGSYDTVHLVMGVAVSVIVALLNPVDPDSAFRGFPWLGVLGYLPWLFGRVLKSGIHLTKLILSPSLPIAPKLIRHRSTLESDGALVVLGNSITLTPGTITVEVEPGELVVHAIDDGAGEDLTGGRLERKIGALFGTGRRRP